MDGRGGWEGIRRGREVEHKYEFSNVGAHVGNHCCRHKCEIMNILLRHVRDYANFLAIDF